VDLIKITDNNSDLEFVVLLLVVFAGCETGGWLDDWPVEGGGIA